jgi:hypothetical protein
MYQKSVCISYPFAHYQHTTLVLCKRQKSINGKQPIWTAYFYFRMLEVGEENGMVFIVPVIAGIQGTIGLRLAPP